MLRDCFFPPPPSLYDLGSLLCLLVASSLLPHSRSLAVPDPLWIFCPLIPFHLHDMEHPLAKLLFRRKITPHYCLSRNKVETMNAVLIRNFDPLDA